MASPLKDSMEKSSPEQRSPEPELKSTGAAPEEIKGKEEELKTNPIPSRNHIPLMNPHPLGMGVPMPIGMMQPPPPYQDPKYMLPMPNSHGVMYPGMFAQHQGMMRPPPFMNPFMMNHGYSPMNPMGMGMGMGMMPMPPNPMMGGMMPFSHMPNGVRPMNLQGI
jgi:hypothetical protein